MAQSGNMSADSYSLEDRIALIQGALNSLTEKFSLLQSLISKLQDRIESVEPLQNQFKDALKDIDLNIKPYVIGYQNLSARYNIDLQDIKNKIESINIQNTSFSEKLKAVQEKQVELFLKISLLETLPSTINTLSVTDAKISKEIEEHKKTQASQLSVLDTKVESQKSIASQAYNQFTSSQQSLSSNLEMVRQDFDQRFVDLKNMLQEITTKIQLSNNNLYHYVDSSIKSLPITDVSQMVCKSDLQTLKGDMDKAGLDAKNAYLKALNLDTALQMQQRKLENVLLTIQQLKQ